jgi:hypothetical protein
MRRRMLLAALAALAFAPGAMAWAEEGGEGGEGAPRRKQPYLQLPTVAVSIVRATGRRGVLTVEVGLDVPDPKMRDSLGLYLPRLSSAYVGALQPYALGLSPGQPPNADYISTVLQRETDRVLGRRGARLLLGSILLN